MPVEQVAFVFCRSSCCAHLPLLGSGWPPIGNRMSLPAVRQSSIVTEQK